MIWLPSLFSFHKDFCPLWKLPLNLRFLTQKHFSRSIRALATLLGSMTLLTSWTVGPAWACDSSSLNQEAVTDQSDLKTDKGQALWMASRP